MFTMTKIALSAAIVVGSVTLAAAEHRIQCPQGQTPARQVSPLAAACRARALAPIPDSPTRQQGPGHAMEGWEV
jgi:hypothetical protein